ncbi:MAG TPA: hypothetical protein ENK23_05675 [Sorangium sp.]|nr:hypothetical protein [Sorangium sp.]
MLQSWCRRHIGAAVALTGVAGVLAASSAGCENYDGVVVVPCPSPDNFAPVSRLVEKRCGTIDCHGGANRPMRIYGQRGRRLDPEDIPGGRATTDEELRANLESMCHLEPERMIRFRAGEIGPRDLMLLRKPLLLEHHKGGPVLEEGNLGLVCLESWLQGEPNVSTCQTAANQP